MQKYAAVRLNKRKQRWQQFWRRVKCVLACGHDYAPYSGYGEQYKCKICGHIKVVW